MPKHRAVVAKIGDSLSGLAQGWRQDRAIRTQLLFFAIAAVALLIARPPVAWVLTTLALLVIGLAAELLNGAVETLLDRLHPDTDRAIGAAKDMASAAAFVINGAAAVVLVCALVFARS